MAEMAILEEDRPSFLSILEEFGGIFIKGVHPEVLLLMSYFEIVTLLIHAVRVLRGLEGEVRPVDGYGLRRSGGDRPKIDRLPKFGSEEVVGAVSKQYRQG